MNELPWHGIARLRQGLYRFFGAAFLLPDGPRWENLRAGAELLNQQGIGEFGFSQTWDTLVRRLGEPVALSALRDEYVELFVAGRDGPSCPPVESRYGLHTPDCAAPSAIVKLERQYRNLGFAKSPEVSLPPDHVTVELEVAALLCERECEAWDQSAYSEVARVLGFELAFLRQHPARWLPRFAEHLEAVAPAGFYADLVAAVASFVAHDHQLVTLLLQERPERQFA